MFSNKLFPSKLLLFGEYTIFINGVGFAIPFSQYHGQWGSKEEQTIESNYNINMLESNKAIQKLSDFIVATGISGLDTKKLDEDIKNGLCFKSNIPLGYGVGSSASLSAAVYDTYSLEQETDLHKVKEKLAEIEAFFHGKSSGIDPLVSYTSSSIFINKDQIELKEYNSMEDNFFLIDTNQSRSTKGFVKYFMERYESDQLFNDKMNELAALNKKAIGLFNNTEEEIFDVIKEISYIQYDYLAHMIPDKYKKKWKKSLDEDDFAIKLNGAGGGGFLIGYKK